MNGKSIFHNKIANQATSPEQLLQQGNWAMEIPALARQVWLYTGAEGPPLAAQDAALQRYLSNRALADVGRQEHAKVECQLRERLATMLGLPHSDIALVSNASEAINLVVGSLQLSPGDNVVLNDLEYPSLVQPWIRLTTRGIELRLAQHKGWSMPAASLAELVDTHTKLICVSHVSYLTGWRHDLTAIANIADRVGAIFLVDATQSLGVIPVPASVADVVISSSYKWLLGGHGLGILAWNQARRPLPEPRAVGWRSVPDVFTEDRFQRIHLHSDARRFEVGFPSYPSIYCLDCSIAWLQYFDIRTIEQHVLTQTSRLIDELLARNWIVLTPKDPALRAGNVSVATDHGHRTAQFLSDLGVRCWGGDGRLRFSVHLFNTDSDIDKVLHSLDRLPKDLRPPFNGSGVP